MTPTATPLYAGLLALMFIYLAVRVIRLRRRERIALGDSGSPALQRAIRVHANFAEYAPLALIVLAGVEALGFPALLVHGLFLALVAGRAAHAYGVSQAVEDYRWRTAGMALTFAVLGVGGTLAVLGALLR